MLFCNRKIIFDHFCYRYFSACMFQNTSFVFINTKSCSKIWLCLRNLLESEEWKDSINTLFLELRSKLPEFFKEVPLPTIPHEDYVEVVIPASKQVMMEDLVEWLEKKLGLHILYASKQNYGKLLKAAAYSTPVDGSMFIIHMGSEQYGVIDSLTVHFYDSDETMLLGIQHVLRDVTRVPAEVLEYQKMDEILSFFF